MIIRKTLPGLLAALILATFLSPPIAFAQSPTITVTIVPACGTTKPLQGVVSGVVAADYKLAIYANSGGWWNKPTWAKPLTNISKNGKWTAKVSTGGDLDATQFAVFLVPVGYVPPSLAGEAILPAELETNAAAVVIKTRHCDRRELEFSGYTWEVREATELQGPGPNYFSKGAQDIFVDSLGRLHLKIVKRGGKWYSSEVTNETPMGYGTYVFHIASRVDKLDPNVVLGLFTWDNDSPEVNYREIDIEFAHWGDPDILNTQFVVQPYATDGNMQRFDTLLANKQKSTHGFEWLPGQIDFQSMWNDQVFPGSADVIQSWSYTGSDVPVGGMPHIHINLWLTDGAPPTNYHSAEVIIDRFEFIPAP